MNYKCLKCNEEKNATQINLVWSDIPPKAICKSCQPERSKREDMKGPSHLPDKGWPEKNAGFP